MKATITITFLLLLLLPGLCFGEKIEADVYKDIAESVFRYEFQHFATDVLDKKYSASNQYKATHFAIQTEQSIGFTVDDRYLLRFAAVTPLVIKYSDLSHINYCYSSACVSIIYEPNNNNDIRPIIIKIKKIKMLSDGLFEVEAVTSININGGYASWPVRFNVTNNNGSWVTTLIRRKNRSHS